MTPLETQLSSFQPISLDQLDGLGLMTRFDTKFLFHIEKLQDVFAALNGKYRMLTVNDTRAFRYRTLYFDTHDFFYYGQHHDQRVNRYKFRYRSYLETGQSYFEVKRKTNKKKTVKTRILLENPIPKSILSHESRQFAKLRMYNGNASLIDRLRPALYVDYRRITLTDTENQERITFDLDLCFYDDERRINLDYLVIAELKQASSSVKSDFFHLLKTRGVHPVKFSKYCMGVVLMKKSPKTNRFKQNVLFLKKLKNSCHPFPETTLLEPYHLTENKELVCL